MEKQEQSPICPYCLSPIETDEKQVVCPLCGVAHHPECWRTNGKCSVYGCDGWQAWSSGIADRIAPRVGGDIDLEESGVEPSQPEEARPVCIECGRPVRRGQLTCLRCRLRANPIYHSCFGTSIIILGGASAAITLIVKGLS